MIRCGNPLDGASKNRDQYHHYTNAELFHIANHTSEQVPAQACALSKFEQGIKLVSLEDEGKTLAGTEERTCR
jgi:hypothetical protein